MDQLCFFSLVDFPRVVVTLGSFARLVTVALSIYPWVFGTSFGVTSQLFTCTVAPVSSHVLDFIQLN